MITDDPVAFLKKNTLLVGNPFTGSGLKWAKLETVESNWFSGNVYRLADAGGDGKGHFKVYWCHYAPDETHICSLAKDASLMFTAPMTGCTFGIGISASDGTVTVGHANISNTQDQYVQEIFPDIETDNMSADEFMAFNDARREIIRTSQLKKLVENFGAARLERKLDDKNATYAQAGAGVITFGVLSRAPQQKWRFYFQTRNGRNQVTGVYKIKK